MWKRLTLLGCSEFAQAWKCSSVLHWNVKFQPKKSTYIAYVKTCTGKTLMMVNRIMMVNRSMESTIVLGDLLLSYGDIWLVSIKFLFWHTQGKSICSFA
jgi:hypothetical protein